MGPEHLVAGVMVAGLVVYVLGGGADFGGGVWDLLATGPRKKEQRALVEKAIGPVWEANHVWFIFVFVLLFSAFPPAFAALTTALFMPLTLYAIGLVLRGSAFTFRHYDENEERRRRFGALFSAASIGCPFLLGAMGALLVREAPLASDMTDPFAISGGVFLLALVAALAATYLTVEAEDEALREDFRRRALASLGVAGAASWAALWVARTSAPRLVAQVTGRGVTVAATGLGVLALALLFRRHYRAARGIVILLVTSVVIGWAAAKGEVLVPPSTTLASARAHAGTLRVLLVASAIGALVLVPSLGLLYSVFGPRGGRGGHERGAPHDGT